MKASLLNRQLIHLVTLLSDGQYHDGTKIGAELNLTRSAVWKLINKLKHYGIAIRSIKNKGYVLLEPLTLLDATFITNHLPDKTAVLEVYEYMSSTNDYLKQYVNRDELRFCFAEMQTEGRGRMMRNWYSPFAENIYFSSLYSFHRDLGDLAGLSLVVSLAIVKALASYQFTKPLLVKWPNDVICDHKKLAGTLVEVQGEANGISKAIIGIGINVNMLHNKWHDISQDSDIFTGIDRTLFKPQFTGSAFDNLFMQLLEKFAQQGLIAFLDEWQTLDALRNEMVILRSLNTEVNGQAKGINAKGHLLLKKANEEVHSFSAGEVEKIRTIGY